MESPAEGCERYLETLNFVINFLHAEGYRTAEQSLLKEIEVRYPQEAGQQPAASEEAPAVVTSAPQSSSGNEEFQQPKPQPATPSKSAER